MTQAVLDIRRAAAWLAARDEVADDQIGIMGISLGGITGALAVQHRAAVQEGLPAAGRRRHGRSGLDLDRNEPSCARSGRPTGHTKEELFDILQAGRSGDLRPAGRRDEKS